jgi:muconolactone delta-isomerase
MSKLKKVMIIVASTLFIASLVGNYKLSRMKIKSDKIIEQLQASIKDQSKEITVYEDKVDSLIDDIQDQASEIIRLKNFKPKIKYVKVKDKDTVKSNLYNKVVIDLDLCMAMNSDMMESVKRIKLTADVMELRFETLKSKLNKREAEYAKLVKFTLDERKELYKRLSRKFFLVIGPSVSISSDFTFRFSLSLTYGKKIF